MDGLKGDTSFKGLALPASLWGSGWGRSPWAPVEVFAVCLSGHAWPFAGGASLLCLSLQKGPIQGIMRNGISTKWRENALFL